MRSSTRFVFPLGLVAAAAAAGCATPEPLVTLAPRNPAAVAWVEGRAVVAKEMMGVRVAAAFEQQAGNGLGVRVEIENDTGVPFEIGPADITYMTCLDVANSTCDGSFAVTDPELVLGALDEQGSRARANAANGQAFYGSLFLLSAVTDVATVAAGKADATTGVATAALAEEGAAVAANGRETLSSIGSERQLWTNVALRKNTLLPGHGAAGLVFIPVDLRARYLWMHVRAGGQVFAFGFKQIVRRVDANGMSHRS